MVRPRCGSSWERNEHGPAADSTSTDGECRTGGGGDDVCKLFGEVVPDIVAMLGARATAAGSAHKLDLLDEFAQLSVVHSDGWGIAHLSDDGEVVVAKSSRQALSDRRFGDAARIPSRARIAHLRAASFARSSEENSHPFQMESMAMAHNGAFYELPAVEALISPERRAAMKGDTDSERYLALVETKVDQCIRELVEAGQPVDMESVRDHALLDAAEAIGRVVPTYSLNALVLATDGVRALRLPDARGLYMHRAPLDDAQRGAHALVLDSEPAITRFASDPLDGLEGWTEIKNGELVHARLDGTVHREMATGALARQVGLDEAMNMNAASAAALGDRGGVAQHIGGY